MCSLKNVYSSLYRCISTQYISISIYREIQSIVNLIFIIFIHQYLNYEYLKTLLGVYVYIKSSCIYMPQFSFNQHLGYCIFACYEECSYIHAFICFLVCIFERKVTEKSQKSTCSALLENTKLFQKWLYQYSS